MIGMKSFSETIFDLNNHEVSLTDIVTTLVPTHTAKTEI